MQKRWLLNLGLALLVLALGLFVVLAPRQPEQSQTKPLTSVDAESITHISIHQSGQEEVRMEKDGNTWRLVAPMKARADSFRIDNLLQLLSARSEGTLPASDPGKYGLDKPLARVRFNDTEITFGALHAFNNLQYVAYQNAVHLVPAEGVRAAAQPWQHFLSTALLDPELKPLHFTFSRFSLTLDGGSWQLTPANKNISSDRINTFVEEWRFARAFSVERHEGRAPKSRIKITHVVAGDTSASPKVLEIGLVETSPEVVLYRADEGLDYHFPASIGERLLELKPE